MAFEKVKEGKTDFLVPILLEDLSKQSLPRDIQTYIKTYTYIDARKYDIETLRKKIRFAMPDKPLKNLKQMKENPANKLDGILQEIDMRDVSKREDVENGRKEIFGGILRLLEEDGKILEVKYPTKLQEDSDDEDTRI